MPYLSLKQGVRPAYPLSLEQITHNGFEVVCLPDHLSQCEVKLFISNFPEREQNIIRLFELGYQQKEVAKEVGLSPGRICQLKKTMRQVFKTFFG